jgi:hypothetical protein
MTNTATSKNTAFKDATEDVAELLKVGMHQGPWSGLQIVDKDTKRVSSMHPTIPI